VQEVAEQLEASFRGERKYVKNNYPGQYDYNKSSLPSGVFPSLNNARQDPVPRRLQSIDD